MGVLVAATAAAGKESGSESERETSATAGGSKLKDMGAAGRGTEEERSLGLTERRDLAMEAREKGWMAEGRRGRTEGVGDASAGET